MYRQKHLLLFVPCPSHPNHLSFPQEGCWWAPVCCLGRKEIEPGHFWSQSPGAEATLTIFPSHSPCPMGKVLCLRGPPTSSGTQSPTSRRCRRVHTHTHTHTHTHSSSLPDCDSGSRLRLDCLKWALRKEGKKGAWFIPKRDLGCCHSEVTSGTVGLV